jgi:hypothetical protein
MSGYIPPHMRQRQLDEQVKEMNASTDSNLFPQLINSTADNSTKPKISFATHAIDWGKKKEEERLDGMRKSIREERIKGETEFVKASAFSHFKKRRPPTGMKPSSNIPLNEEVKVKCMEDGEGEWQVVCNRKTKKPKVEKQMTEEEFNKSSSSEDDEEEGEDTYWRN